MAFGALRVQGCSRGKLNPIGRVKWADGWFGTDNEGQGRDKAPTSSVCVGNKGTPILR